MVILENFVHIRTEFDILTPSHRLLTGKEVNKFIISYNLANQIVNKKIKTFGASNQ